MQLLKKTTALLFMAFLFLALLITMPFSGTALAKKPVVFVSILPQKYFVEQIAGDTVDVEVMVMPGASPATYEPRPRQMAKLATAEVYLAIGVPFERTWLPRIQDTNPDLTIVHVDNILRKLPMAASAIDVDENPRGAILEDYRHESHEAHEAESTHEAHATHDMHEHHTHGHKHEDEQHVHKHSHVGMFDPHIWLSPRWVKAMAKPTRLALSKIAPQHAKQYRINTRAFTKQLDELDKEIDAIFNPIPPEKRAFMTFHPSWGYYAMTYNLIQIPIEFEGKAPTPMVLEKITEIAKKRNLRTIFVQPQFSQSSAKAIADSINGTIVVADPLAEDWEENLRTISKKLAASFIL
ncbi:zinc ABC transporter substrate-binding protein [Halodesulfovibrio sp.]|jgi:zinc transport system substrate-binding protein|uniref:metal ABC transporter solute-binding protein, Zn/Mn family n=1 Tax=Halodesulfovibrio sp. TaxID=1912772 RepID=UPI0025E2772E|nr:zinc ABC transporter substrate-binding protein [Halodesulfovibrio sp.]MCT4627174.1 zinc ABC transporter substrate-binding protein [Halodesulfovibrio sp.]